MIQFAPAPNSAVLSLGTKGAAINKAVRPAKAVASCHDGSPVAFCTSWGGLRALALMASRLAMRFSITLSEEIQGISHALIGILGLTNNVVLLGFFQFFARRHRAFPSNAAMWDG
jgi:hypothetical protein